MSESVYNGVSVIDEVKSEREKPDYKAETVAEKRDAGEKPQASQEIVIEEISIDGMCGVY